MVVWEGKWSGCWCEGSGGEWEITEWEVEG